VSLKNILDREFGVSTRLRFGAPGALDVLVNGEQIYCKKQTGRMPTADELVKLIRTKVSGE
jgi:predicted Rdx family selenoprotein